MSKILKKVSLKTRVHGIYSAMAKRFGPKYWKSGKRQGRLREPGIQLPFSEAELLSGMERAFPGGAARNCPYCGAAIDPFSCTLDHEIPITRGGSLGLENIGPICARCNALKGEMKPAEFHSFLVWLKIVGPAARADIEKRLLSGGMGMRLRYYGIRERSQG